MGHFDSELDRPEDLDTKRLGEIINECLDHWTGFPTIPGSLRWGMNGKIALQELLKRAGERDSDAEEGIRKRG